MVNITTTHTVPLPLSSSQPTTTTPLTLPRLKRALLHKLTNPSAYLPSITHTSILSDSVDLETGARLLERENTFAAGQAPGWAARTGGRVREEVSVCEGEEEGGVRLVFEMEGGRRVTNILGTVSGLPEGRADPGVAAADAVQAGRGTGESEQGPAGKEEEATARYALTYIFEWRHAELQPRDRAVVRHLRKRYAAVARGSVESGAATLLRLAREGVGGAEVKAEVAVAPAGGEVENAKGGGV